MIGCRTIPHPHASLAGPRRLSILGLSMPAKLQGQLVIATHNAGKLKEMRELLAPYGVAAVSAAELGFPEPEETGASFVENAAIKAQAAADRANIPALSDELGALRRCAEWRSGHQLRPMGGSITRF